MRVGRIESSIALDPVQYVRTVVRNRRCHSLRALPGCETGQSVHHFGSLKCYRPELAFGAHYRVDEVIEGPTRIGTPGATRPATLNCANAVPSMDFVRMLLNLNLGFRR